MRQSCYAEGHLSFRLHPIKSVRLIVVFSSQKLQLNFSIYSAAGSKIGSVTAFVKLICNYHFADVKLQFAHVCRDSVKLTSVQFTVHHVILVD